MPAVFSVLFQAGSWNNPSEVWRSKGGTVIFHITSQKHKGRKHTPSEKPEAFPEDRRQYLLIRAQKDLRNGETQAHRAQWLLSSHDLPPPAASLTAGIYFSAPPSINFLAPLENQIHHFLIWTGSQWITKVCSFTFLKPGLMASATTGTPGGGV